jgi:branched-chain amino acid transport system substrate-binding protein
VSVLRPIGTLASLAMLAVVLCAVPCAAQDVRPLRVGIVTFLSGPGAAPFGVPARNAAEFVIDALNSGSVPAPHQARGFGGRPVEMALLDEAGPVSKVVTEYRNLVERRGVDIVIGYVSSASCLAVAPVAEQLRRLTVIFNCGTPRLFEDATYRYVFRTASHSVMDSVAAAMYVRDRFPGATRVGGINQNYAWGQDSWRDFEAAMKALAPRVQIVTSQMPKLFAGQYGAEISALMQSRSEVIHSSLWGTDLEAFLLQSAPRGLARTSHLVLTTGETAVHKMGASIPDGTVIGARGPHGVFAPDNALNRWFAQGYEKRYGSAALFTSYHMAQAILGTKAAYEKAKAAAGRDPDQEQIAAAFRGLTFDTPSGTTKMALGNGHQGIQGTAYGTTRLVNGKLTLIDVRRYSAEQVNPPAAMTSEDWIRSGLPRP